MGKSGSHVSSVRSLNILDFRCFVVAKDCHTSEEYHHNGAQRDHNHHQVPILDSLDVCITLHNHSNHCVYSSLTLCLAFVTCT